MSEVKTEDKLLPPKFGINQATWDAIDLWGKRAAYTYSGLMLINFVWGYTSRVITFTTPILMLALTLTFIMLGLMYWMFAGMERLNDDSFLDKHNYWYDTLLKRVSIVLFLSQIVFVISLIGLIFQINVAYKDQTVKSIGLVGWMINPVLLSSLCSVVTSMLPGRMMFLFASQSVERDMKLLATVSQGQDGNTEIAQGFTKLIGALTDKFHELQTRLDTLEQSKSKRKKT